MPKCDEGVLFVFGVDLRMCDSQKDIRCLFHISLEGFCERKRIQINLFRGRNLLCIATDCRLIGNQQIGVQAFNRNRNAPGCRQGGLKITDIGLTNSNVEVGVVSAATASLCRYLLHGPYQRAPGGFRPTLPQVIVGSQYAGPDAPKPIAYILVFDSRGLELVSAQLSLHETIKCPASIRDALQAQGGNTQQPN